MGKPARRPAGFEIRRDAWRVYALGTNPPRIGQNP